MARHEVWQKLYPQLMDKEWLMTQIRAGLGSRKIAAMLGCGDHTVRKAYKYHNIKRPFATVNNSKLNKTLDKIP